MWSLRNVLKATEMLINAGISSWFLNKTLSAQNTSTCYLFFLMHFGKLGGSHIVVCLDADFLIFYIFLNSKSFLL